MRFIEDESHNWNVFSIEASRLNPSVIIPNESAHGNDMLNRCPLANTADSRNDLTDPYFMSSETVHLSLLRLQFSFLVISSSLWTKLCSILR
ncbi:MAG: hypothetical protein SFV81_12855, partial [Pirellulaceae bacterium]|nr:hypothetical protein [Pirellulaceae bacterium]